MSNPPVTLQEFTIYFSPNELNGKYDANMFIFLIQESGGTPGLFMLEQVNFSLDQSKTVQNRSNALLFSGDPSELGIGTYIITLLVNPFELLPYPIATFTLNITEGNSNLSKVNGSSFHILTGFLVPLQLQIHV